MMVGGEFRMAFRSLLMKEVIWRLAVGILFGDIGLVECFGLI